MIPNFQLAQKYLINKSGRAGLILQKYAPELMLVGGLSAFIVAAVMASKASMRAQEAIDDSKDDIDQIKKGEEHNELVPQDQYQRDLVMAYARSGMRFVKLYGPSVSLGAAGVFCILGSHGLMRKRQVAIVAAYNLVSQSFNEYKKRVIEKIGDAEEYSLRHGTTLETVEAIDSQTGKKKKVKAQVIGEKTHPSEYARFFDESSHLWQKDAATNRFFLSMKQNYLNDLFISRGHVLLNEVYDELGLPRSQAGCIVGWVKGKGDQYIDFGMYRFGNEDFVNGYERSVLLDFNVAGVVFDQI